MQFSVISLANKIQTEADAYRLLEDLRWNGEPVCPHCGSDRAYFLNSDLGEVRKTRTGNKTQRRVWKCGECRKQYSAITGTVMHGTKLPIRIWLFVLFEMAGNKNGISAREIERKYGIAPRSAWFMTQRIREAMKRDPLASLMSGTIVADETFVGGEPKNRHQQGKRRPGSGKGFAGAASDKTPVVSLIDVETGEVRSKVVREVNGDTLREAIAESVDIANSRLMTDAAQYYRQLGRDFQSHEWVDHSGKEYVRGKVTTNHAEGFFSQFKRSLDGTHHQISKKHLERYLAEFDFRYSTRKLNDSVRMRKIVEQAEGRRLAYKPLKVG